ncbi:MAG TPA: hypothetical protein VK281_15760, partial [Xanthobacteraceae bacterium]|nr:hypothetical protein [Xanthobacteraceae bacterium]
MRVGVSDVKATGSTLRRRRMIQQVVDAIDTREAQPEDALALSRAIEVINGQTEFLGERGIPVPWADA